jgi:hypothetical protein
MGQPRPEPRGRHGSRRRAVGARTGRFRRGQDQTPIRGALFRPDVGPAPFYGVGVDISAFGASYLDNKLAVGRVCKRALAETHRH